MQRDIEVFVANSDGSQQRQVTSPSANEYELRSDDPSWSPDGHRIAFLRELAANSRLAILSIASGKTRLLDVHGMINDPVWGKPGIAYLNRSKRSSSAPFTIRIADPTTGRARPFASPLPGYSFRLMAWSSRHALAALEGNGATARVTIYAGTGRRVGGFQVRKHWTTCGIAWSPHGTRLLLSAYRGGQINPKTRQPNPQLFTVNPSGKHWQRLPLGLGLTSCNVSWR